KARAVSAAIDSAEIAVKVHKFPKANLPTFDPPGSDHYSFPITIVGSAAVGDSSDLSTIVRIDLYRYYSLSMRLAYQTGGSVSSTSSSFGRPLLHGGVLESAWAVALDSDGCVSPTYNPSDVVNGPTVVEFRIYSGALDKNFPASSLNIGANNT